MLICAHRACTFCRCVPVLNLASCCLAMRCVNATFTAFQWRQISSCERVEQRLKLVAQLPAHRALRLRALHVRVREGRPRVRHRHAAQQATPHCYLPLQIAAVLAISCTLAAPGRQPPLSRNCGPQASLWRRKSPESHLPRAIRILFVCLSRRVLSNKRTRTA